MDTQPSPLKPVPSPTPLDLSTLAPDEWNTWYGVLERAFGGVAEAPEERALWHDLTEFDRSIAVYDGKPTKQLVAASSAFSFRAVVPGGAEVPAAGITMVGVLGTHRRRGVLSAMMRRLLDDARERDEPLAVLTASEPAIYGRFGFGVASRKMRVSIPRHRVRIVPPSDPSGFLPHGPVPRLRMVDAAEAAPACEELYRRVGPGRPGWLARPDGWERQAVLDPESYRGGGSPLMCVLAEDPEAAGDAGGGLRGYSRYSVKPGWEWQGAKGTVNVRDVQAADPVAYAELWRYLLEIDLTDTVVCANLPVDDPLLELVTDARRCDAGVVDSLHARLVDLRAALSARRYTRPMDVVLEVADDFCPWNEGRWRLSADAEGRAVCERTADQPDLALTARELGAAYFGATSLAQQAGAGRIAELRPGALAEASGAFATDVAPWLPRGF
ncbi:GNAT family N-acetyltransferase [Phaeacidiphilus oryzae]|uniref:GNAT family N-acetyltransferase n=1 Tax=Phaeacidiphilus oryzae TaxID=348818 RepID=UPI000690906C|nr:GNAT family N-acetyltransferase [Phaeacidiphilus oryzae]